MNNLFINNYSIHKHPNWLKNEHFLLHNLNMWLCFVRVTCKYLILWFTNLGTSWYKMYTWKQPPYIEKSSSLSLFFFLILLFQCFEVKWSEVAQSCPTLWDLTDCSPPGSSVHGIFQARVLEWVTISFFPLLSITSFLSLPFDLILLL